MMYCRVSHWLTRIKNTSTNHNCLKQSSYHINLSLMGCSTHWPGPTVVTAWTYCLGLKLCVMICLYTGCSTARPGSTMSTYLNILSQKSSKIEFHSLTMIDNAHWILSETSSTNHDVLQGVPLLDQDQQYLLARPNLLSETSNVKVILWPTTILRVVRDQYAALQWLDNHMCRSSTS